MPWDGQARWVHRVLREDRGGPRTKVCKARQAWLGLRATGDRRVTRGRSVTGVHGVSMARMALTGCRGRWEGGVPPVSRVCRDLRAQRGLQVSMGSTGKRDLEGLLAPTETMASLVCRAKTVLTGRMERREATAQTASRARRAAMVPMEHTGLTAPPRHLLQSENGVECWLRVGKDVPVTVAL